MQIFHGITEGHPCGGCTNLVQPLETAFKEYLREFIDQYIEKHESQRPSLVTDGWTLSDKRIMTTHVVGDAWDQFCKDKKDMVCKASGMLE